MNTYNNFDEFVNDVINAPGFMDLIDLELLELNKGHVKAKLNPSVNHENIRHEIHGGCLYAVADTIGGIAAATYGNAVTTTTGNMHYFISADAQKELYLDAVSLKAGRNLITVDVGFQNDDGRLVCKGTFEYYVLRQELPQMNE